MEDMEIDQVVYVPDTPDRAGARHINVERPRNQGNPSVHGNSGALEDKESFGQLRTGNSSLCESRHNGRMHFRRQRIPVNSYGVEPQNRSNTFSMSQNPSLSQNGPLFRRAPVINHFKHESSLPSIEQHADKAKKSGQQDDLNCVFDIAFPRGASKHYAGERNSQISSSDSGSFLHSTPVCSRISGHCHKGKEKVDNAASNGFGLAANSGNVIDLSSGSHHRNTTLATSPRRPVNLFRSTGQRRLVRNGCISPVNIASHLQKSAESVQVGSMFVEKSHGENRITDGQSQADIKKIVEESNNGCTGKGKEVMTNHPTPSKHIAKAMDETRSIVIDNKMANRASDACTQASGSWRSTRNHANPCTDLEGDLFGREDASSDASFVHQLLENRESLGDSGNRIIANDAVAAGLSNSGNSTAINGTRESQLGNSYSKRRKKHGLTSNGNYDSSLPVPDDEEIVCLGSSRGSSSSRSSRLHSRQHQGALDCICEINESSSTISSGGYQVIGHTDNNDSDARARQVEEDEMLARELQEQLYHEAALDEVYENAPSDMPQEFLFEQIDEDIASALQQEEFPAVFGQNHHRSSPASSLTLRLSQGAQSRLSRNPYGRRNQVQAPNTMSSQLRNRFLDRPPATRSRVRRQPPVLAGRRSIQFPPGMDMDMRLDLLEALEAAVEGFEGSMATTLENLLNDPQRDFNENDYEMLLALDENNHQRGVSTDHINSLPESVVQTGNFEEACAVCLEVPSIGETIRHLPCLHKFHKECIDPWLSRKASCPVCKSDIS